MVVSKAKLVLAAKELSHVKKYFAQDALYETH
jgi:hypothetical protein